VEAVTWRIAPASRGAVISANDALTLLAQRAARKAQALESSMSAGQKARAERQADELAELHAQHDELAKIIHQATKAGGRIAAQIRSGEGWSMNLKIAGGKSRFLTLSTVVLARSVKAPHVERAHERIRAAKVGVEVFQVGPVRLTVSYL
jgi:hypothetical protein